MHPRKDNEELLFKPIENYLNIKNEKERGLDK
jgi:hypothetical protein